MSGAVLTVMSGPRSGERFEVEGELLIGREQAAVTIDDEQVSRRHALVRAVGGIVTIEDLGSTNGTWVNGRRLDPGGSTPLGPDDEIRIGETTLAVEGERQTVVAGSDERHTDGTVVSTPAPSPPPAAPAIPPVAEPATPFAVEDVSRPSGIATRDLRVEALTIGAVGATAVGLVLYFALR
jgi:pSer/pThr/pTyr-binding forkhead associated (FHA) protein